MILALTLVLAQTNSLGARPATVTSKHTGVSMSYPRAWKVTVAKPTQRPIDGSFEADDADKPIKDTLLLRIEKGQSAYAELRESSWAKLLLKRSLDNDQLSWQHSQPLESHKIQFSDGYTPVMVGKQKACVQMWENKAGDDDFTDVVEIDIQEAGGKIFRFLGKAEHHGVVNGRMSNDGGVMMPSRPVPEMAAALPVFEAMVRSIKATKGKH